LTTQGSQEAEDGISNDLSHLNFNSHYHKDDHESVILIGLSDENVLLEAAERENHMCKWTCPDSAKQEKNTKKREARKNYLDPLIQIAEEKRPFKLAQRKEFEGGDIDLILSEADKSRLFFNLLDRIELSSMPETQKALKIGV
jgi:hypothetical protein